MRVFHDLEKAEHLRAFQDLAKKLGVETHYAPEHVATQPRAPHSPAKKKKGGRGHKGTGSIHLYDKSGQATSTLIVMLLLKRAGHIGIKWEALEMMEPCQTWGAGRLRQAIYRVTTNKWVTQQDNELTITDAGLGKLVSLRSDIRHDDWTRYGGDGG